LQKEIIQKDAIIDKLRYDMIQLNANLYHNNQMINELSGSNDQYKSMINSLAKRIDLIEMRLRR